jgi:CBS domain-containing protein
LIASELMTHAVITVPADATVQDAARLMLESGARAAPVVDSAGQPIGMISDGDLLGRRTQDGRREWWLEMLAGAAVPSVTSNRAGLRRVSDVMSAPLIFVAPDTPADEIASLLHWRRIKRLPVLRTAAWSASSAAPICSPSSNSWIGCCGARASTRQD